MLNKHTTFLSLIALCTSALLTGCGGGGVESDEDFLASVRESAKTDARQVESPGLIDPNVEYPAKIELETNQLDMGYIPLGEPTSTEVLIHNRGKEPLKMGNIKTSCACTTGKMENNIIAPGETGKLIVTVDPSKFAGVEVTKVLTIYSNDPVDTQLFLAVKSTISGELIMSAENFDFGTIKAGESATQSIIVKQTRPETVAVKEIIYPQGSHDSITVSVKEVPASEWENPEHAEHELIAQIGPDLEPGVYTLEVMVLFEHERYQQFTFPINVTIN